MDEETHELVPTEVRSPSETDAGGAPALPATGELAAHVIHALDMIAEKMELESPHPSTARRVRGARTVPRQFVAAMAAAVESTPEMQKLGTFDAAEAREVLEASDAYREVAERVARLLASLNYTIEARWAKVASAAMLTFTIARINAKNPGQAKLAARVESLAKVLGRKGTKKKKPKP